MINKIFVYGTLQRGMYNSSFINDEWINWKTNATTKGKLYMVKGATYPALIRTKGNETVHGELYEIKDKFLKDAIKSCDHLEGHPSFYKRIQTKVYDENGNKHTAYVYEFMLKDMLGKIIQSGVYKDEYNDIIEKRRKTWF